MRELIINIATTTAIAAVVTIAAIVLKKVLGYADAWLKSKKTKAEAEGKQSLADLFESASVLLNAVTTTTVSKIEATKAAALRKAVHAGQAAVGELNLLSDEAYEEIVAQLTPAVVSVLAETVDDVEIYIRNKIEEVLPGVKQKYKALITGETGNEAGA